MSNSKNKEAVERVSLAFMPTKLHTIDTLGFAERLLRVMTEERNKVDNLPCETTDKAMALCRDATKDLRRALQRFDVAHKRLVEIANEIGVIEAYGPDCVPSAHAKKLAA